MAKSTDNNQEVSTIISDSNQSTMNEDEEAIHFRKVIGAFLYYRTSARNRVRRAFYSYGRLPEAHKRLVPKYESYLSQLLKCIDQKNNFSSTQILVPGAGLGRLSWEFARLGYACQGNE
ncbi:unnamed protein product, partial [Rotaria socialis]